MQQQKVVEPSAIFNLTVTLSNEGLGTVCTLTIFMSDLKIIPTPPPVFPFLKTWCILYPWFLICAVVLFLKSVIHVSVTKNKEIPLSQINSRISLILLLRERTFQLRQDIPFQSFLAVGSRSFFGYSRILISWVCFARLGRKDRFYQLLSEWIAEKI